MRVPVNAESTSADEAPAILHEQVRLLYHQALPGLLASLFNGTVVVLVLWPIQPASRLLTWWSVLTLITLARAYSVIRYRRDTQVAAHTRSWLWRFALGAFAVGACWGAAGTVLFPADRPGYQMFLLTVLAGTSAGAVPLFGSVWSVYAAYTAPMLLPTVAWLLNREDSIHNYIGLMVFVYTIVVLGSAARIARNIKSSLRLSFERLELVERLSQSKRELEQINAQLQREGQRRNRAQLKLLDSNRFLKRIMDSAQEGIFVLDREGRITRINQFLADLAQQPPAQLLGSTFADLLPETNRTALATTFERVVQHGETGRCDDLEVRAADGSARSLSVSIAPLLDGQRVTAMVGVARDVTEQRELERMKEDFISTVSHELRTPLTSIRGALGLVTRTASADLKEQTRSLLAIADSNSERLLRLIDDLLDLQRLTLTRMRFVFSRQELTPLVEHAVEINRAYAQQYNVEFRLESMADSAVVRVDRDRFIQIMTNLLSNAAKFSSPGSEVRIAIENVEFGVRISVQDSGPGIPPEFGTRIFQRFAQVDSSDSRRKGGTGLGLNISKFLIEAMNGRIGFYSELGRGSTFYVELPVGHAPATMDGEPKNRQG